MTFHEAITEADREWEERVIPNGKEMNWNGHRLVFESESSKCRGCFFGDKNECPDCDEGVWVEENPWCTGTPTEEGWYLLAFVEDGRRIYDANRLKKGIWEYCLIGDIVEWQKIQDEPREEK